MECTVQLRVEEVNGDIRANIAGLFNTNDVVESLEQIFEESVGNQIACDARDGLKNAKEILVTCNDTTRKHKE